MLLRFVVLIILARIFGGNTVYMCAYHRDSEQASERIAVKTLVGKASPERSQRSLKQGR